MTAHFVKPHRQVSTITYQQDGVRTKVFVPLLLNHQVFPRWGVLSDLFSSPVSVGMPFILAKCQHILIDKWRRVMACVPSRNTPIYFLSLLCLKSFAIIILHCKAATLWSLVCCFQMEQT
jgi:hypothetical protein